MTFVLGDTDAEAQELAEIVRREQVSGPTAMVFLEQLWNRELSEYDPDGPLPDVDPIEGESIIAPGSIPARSFTGRRQATADEWRAQAAAEGLSIRELMVRKAARQTFVGSAGDDRGAARRARPVARVRRLHPRAAHHAGRAGRLRRPGRAAPAGARLVPDGVRGYDPA